MRYSKNQISKTLAAARRLLKGPVQPAARIAEVLHPCMDCTEVAGVSGQCHDDIRSSIFALMGDAYRREGNAQLAAQWYRRASAISPGGHAPTYAHVVCKHELADFYEDALATLEEHRRRLRARPIIARLLRGVVAWAGREGEGREIACGERRNLKFLRERALPTMAKAA